MRLVAPREGSIDEALNLGPALLERARLEGLPVAGATILGDRAILLGARQRAGRVVGFAACAREGVSIVRRATSGIAASITGRAILWALALPDVASLFPDATPRTLLNRNARAFLKGFARAGTPAAYFGRACIVVRKEPLALLGFAVAPSGAVLIEVIAGVDAGLGVPAELATDAEREADARRGTLGGSLAAITRREPMVFAEDVLGGLAAGEAAPLPRPELASGLARVEREDDPMPHGFEVGPVLPVPIGWLDTGRSGERVWLGGDALGGQHLFDDMAAGRTPTSAALDGARLSDPEDACRLALR